MNFEAVAQIVKQFIDGYNSETDQSIKDSNLAHLHVMAHIGKSSPEVYVEKFGERWAKEAKAAAEYILENPDILNTESPIVS